MVDIDFCLYNIDMSELPPWNQMPLRIFSAFRAHCNPDWRWAHPGDAQARFTLWLIAGGGGNMHVAGRDYPLRNGDCFLFRQWQPNEGTCQPTNPPIVPYIVFDWLDSQSRPRPAPTAEMSLPPLYRKILHQDFFETLLQRSIDAHQAGKNETAEHWLRTALMEMTRQDEQPAGTDLEREQLERIDGISRDIQRAPAAFGNMDALAETVGYSKDHFIRLFRKYKGLTPGEFVIRARIQSASELLRFSSHGVTQIARMLGYGDIYAFSKQFRQRTGQSPTAYRQNTAMG